MSEVLSADKHLVSDLWLDQPDALERIDRRLEEGAVSYEEATRLAHFVEHGYLSFRLDGIDTIAEAMQAGIDALWRARPDDLLLACKGESARLRVCDAPESWRETGYRFVDLHSHLRAARDLYLSQALFRYVELLLDEPALAIQSLYFPDGSEQALHRDPMYVVTDPPAHLVASWVALEDITPESGPLLFVPGSHRLPYYEFEPGHVRVPADAGTPENYKGYSELLERGLAKHGLGPRRFLCKRGEVLIWHSSLAHGGCVVDDPESTRRSFVTHYSTRAHYHSRRNDWQEPDAEGGLKGCAAETNLVLERDGCHGLANPIAPDREPIDAPAADSGPESAARPVRRGLRQRLGLG